MFYVIEKKIHKNISKYPLKKNISKMCERKNDYHPKEDYKNGVKVQDSPMYASPSGCARKSETTSKDSTYTELGRAEDDDGSNDVNTFDILSDASNRINGLELESFEVNEDEIEGDADNGGGGRNGGRSNMGDVMTMNEPNDGNDIMQMYNRNDYYANAPNYVNNDDNDNFYEDNGNYGDNGLQIIVNGNDTNFFV